MEVTLPAERDSAPLLRRLLSRWLADRGATEWDLRRRAAGRRRGLLERDRARLPARPAQPSTWRWPATSDEVTVIVRDYGSWRPPRGTNRGRGIKMMEALVDSVEIDRETTGPP